MDKLGRRTKATSPSPQGYETVYTWNSNGFLSQKDVENVDKTDTRDGGNPWWTTTISYDVMGRVISRTEEIATSDTRTTNYTLGGNGNVTQIELPEGNKIQLVWDERGLLAERTRAYQGTGDDPATEKWKYEGNRKMVEYLDGRGKDWENAYDGFGRVTTETTPLGHYTSYALDKNGNVTQIERHKSDDTLLAASKASHDELNRVYSKSEWLDGDDNATIDSGEWIETELDYDKRHLLVWVEDPGGNETDITYDNASRRTRVEDELGNKIDSTFSSDYLVPDYIEEVEVHPVTGTETFKTEFVTDELHRVKERRVVDQTDSQIKHVFKYKFTSLSVMVEQEDAKENKTYWTHDGLGRITKKEVMLDGANKIVTEYTFDENDNLTNLKDDNGNDTTYTYNGRDLLEELEYDDEKTRTFAWLDNDGLSGWTDENGTVVTNSYDDDGRLTGRSIPEADLGPTSESYSYDGLGRMTTASNSDGGGTIWIVDFNFDTLSRLTSEEQGPSTQDQKTIS